ncbi:hypothetical protein A6U87_07265 [Rhizobium sp. AC44/96]|uniref:hypothetical protein n=1 Tax=unclassified Rhizobium TaxID=2613769 RepID=UPI00080FEA8B|nr:MULTISPECIES: hypothetical protein [unclassified Rhizobium]MDM9623356.1 hypothetical protein [Rhizobium sp. S96]OCJ13083.1 hypothetical protein A6U87_07265 [Rhizobium sp. AC44/96]
MPLVRSNYLLVGLLVFSLSSCQTTDKSPQPNFVTDSRGLSITAPAGTATYSHFIEFRSRYALTYGHTYVVFGRVDTTGHMIDPEVAGLAPASPDATPYIVGHVIPVPATTGPTDGDLEEQYRSASWRVMLSDEEYNNVVAFIRKQQANSHFWQASVDNCNNWVGEIARHMGYKTPNIWLRPQQFITELREMNTA